MLTKLRVLVTGVGGRSVGQQVLQALLHFPERYHIIATDADAFSYGLYQVDSRYLLPRAKHPDYLAAILRLVAQQGIQAICPGTPAELAVLAQHQSALTDAGCVLIGCSAEIAALGEDKYALARWLQAHNFRTPATATPSDWQALAAEFGYPLVGKPSAHVGGSRSVAILANASEVAQYLADCATGGVDVLFQEYVGDAQHEYTVGVMVDRNQQVIDSIVIRRHLLGLTLGERRVLDGQTYALSTGYSQGFIIRDAAIQAECERLASELAVVGPLNLQLRLDRAGRVCIFEVHPRFSGTTSIRAQAGFNEPDLLLQNFVYGTTFGRQPYQTDVAAIRAFQNILVPLATLQQVAPA